MEKHYLLGEVAKVLRRKPHQIVHLLTTGKIPEPQQRISNKRLFTAEDVIRLAVISGSLPIGLPSNLNCPDSDFKAPERLTLRPPFEVIQVGETGHEVRDGDGVLFAWAPDRGRGLVLAGLLEAATRG